MRLVIGTRGSPLALWQARRARDALLAAEPGAAVELRTVTTSGDRTGQPAPAKGMFTKELELALLAGGIDLAVHSLKDLPTAIPDGLALTAVPLRDDPADALTSREGGGIEDLPAGATVLCGSLRRQAQLLHRRSDLKISPIRGNIGTRLAKFDGSGAAAMVLAAAGLVRLGLGERISRRLEPTDFLPAPGQGAIAVQCRSDDRTARRLAEAIDDAKAHIAAAAERAVLAGLGGGCRMPIGAYARFMNSASHLELTAMAATPDGSTLVRRSLSADCPDFASAQELGARLADSLRAGGADEILRRLSRAAGATMEEPP